ncbi:MAG: MarR family transcriptional regulator [Minisyncoccia bacterium]
MNIKNREQKIKELMEGFRSLKRSMKFNSTKTGRIPRITPSQWGALMIIDGRKESTIKDIANALNITSSATTQLVDGLVVNGYVIRKENPKDRRQVALTLSNKTKTQVESMKKQFSQKFLKFFEVLDDKEFDQFVLLCKKIFERHSNK